MKQFLLLILLCMCTTLMAKWTPISTDGDSTIYVDRQTIKKQGNQVKIWALYDHKFIQRFSWNSYHSLKILYLFDCKTDYGSVLADHTYSGNMGAGAVTYSDVPYYPTWFPIVPDSIVETLWKTACKK